MKIAGNYGRNIFPFGNTVIILKHGSSKRRNRKLRKGLSSYINILIFQEFMHQLKV
jgi:hypothetical protein